MNSNDEKTFDYTGSVFQQSDENEEVFDYVFCGNIPQKTPTPFDDTQAMEYMPGGGSGLSRKDLEAQRRDLRRQQFFERAKALGLDMNNVADLERLFAEQDLIEQKRAEDKEQENDYGMSM